MANVELDAAITSKLKSAFNVSGEDIQKVVTFFNGTLKPALKVHYLSHLVTTIEEMINDDQKKKLFGAYKDNGKFGGQHCHGDRTRQ